MEVEQLSLHKKLTTLLFMILLVLSMIACTPAEPTPEENPTEDQTPDPGTEQEEGEQEAPDEQIGADLPQTIEINLMVEGMEETRTGTLAFGSMGYYLYTLPDFQLEAEEPNRDVLFFTHDPEFFVRIEAIGNDADLDFVRKNAEEELQHMGQVVEMKGQEIWDEYFRESVFFLHSSQSDFTKNIIVKEVEGSLYKFTMHIPNKEAAEGVTPSLYAMLKTLKNTPE